MTEITFRQQWLLIADGTPLRGNKLQKLAQGKSVMVLDGAYKYAQQKDLKIDVLLGDFDTIDPSDLAEARKTSIQVVAVPDQNKTDLEKGLDYIDRLNPVSICATSVVGRRLQHTLYNLRILKKYYNPHRPIIYISNRESIRYYQDEEVTIGGQINEGIAVLGFPQAIITTAGLKYDVTNYPLQFENGNSISNALAREQAMIKIHGNVLIIHEKIALENQ